MLEDKLHAKLHVPRITYPGHGSESRRSGESKRQGSEVCMVEYIENFPPQLYRLRFVELKGLCQGGIETCCRWTSDDVARLIAGTTGYCGVNEATSIEPL